MSRLVPYAHDVGQRDAGGGAAGTTLPQRIEAISKYVPAEILAFYVPAVPAINAFTDQAMAPGLQWIVFILSWVLVPVYFTWIAKGDGRLPRQILVSGIAFPIWAYVTNRELGPLGGWYGEGEALLALLLFSLLTAFLLPRADGAGR